jgi:hypothetical protein
MTRKSSTASLLLLGLAAYGIYKYSKMSRQEKTRLVEKGKKMIDENIPQSLKNIFNKEEEYPGRYTQA